jgi:cAMP-dependent protein kinase regulator
VLLHHLILRNLTIQQSSLCVEINPEEEEPTHPLGLGTRRLSSTSTDLHSSSEQQRPPQQGLARRASSKGVKLLTSQVGNSVVGNFMQNIHATPLPMIQSYTPPSFAKSEKDAEFISVSLQRNFVFANALSDEDHARRREERLIVDAFEPYQAKSGDIILSMDSVGDYFYILKEGCVNYIVEGKVVRSATRPGQSFGELCLLYDCPPPANCVAGATPSKIVKLWRLNKTTFRQIMALTSIRKDETLRKALKKVPGLELLDDEFINRIADSLDVRQVPKGSVLYKEGDVSDAFYLIEYDGSVQITPAGGKSEVLGPGESFGQEAIHANAPPRTETVMTLERTTIFTMTREALQRVIGSLDDAIQLSQDRRLLQSVPLFRDSDFEGFEIELLAALIERVTFKGGKEIMLEDEMVENPALYVVYDGILEVECEKYPERERALKKGNYFGEGSLLPDKNFRFGGKGGNKCEYIHILGWIAVLAILC